MISSKLRKNNTLIVFYSKIFANVILFIGFIFFLLMFISEYKTYFPIKSVQIFGIQNVDQHTIQEELMPFVNTGFFGIDVEMIKDRLLQSPWISKATVQRVWPDQVLITLVEKKPLARWNNTSLLSAAGEVFTPETNINNNLMTLPLFIGPEGQHIQMIRYYKKLSNLLLPLHFKITRLELASERAWNLTFNNGMRLRVGYKDVLTRMYHFVKVYPKIARNRGADIEYVDLRYSNNGLAVKWKVIT